MLRLLSGGCSRVVDTSLHRDSRRVRGENPMDEEDGTSEAAHPLQIRLDIAQLTTEQNRQRKDCRHLPAKSTTRSNFLQQRAKRVGYLRVTLAEFLPLLTKIAEVVDGRTREDIARRVAKHPLRCNDSRRSTQRVEETGLPPSMSY